MNKPLFPDIVVNGEAISAADIAAEAQNHAAPAGKPGLAWRAAARAMTVRALLLQEAATRELTPDPRELDPGKWETDPEALIRQLLELALDPAAPKAEAIRDVYDADKDRFRAPSLFEPAHILSVAKADDAKAREAAKLKAMAALAVLAQSHSAFDKLAQDQSDCPSRSSGGRLGQISSGDTVPEFEAALTALEVGELSNEPIETRYGFHVVRLDAKSIGDILPFDAVKMKISEALEKSAWAESARDFVDGLIADAEISGIDIAR